ncbi:sensor histidine kinase [Paenibacillus radicis (ex Gao et al. 2016)]|uniref:histidine kinase n=1 Tax=Paenibacillus radicis (ex Gao et al. 2016) TaxID=1737354 RepID=A0A917HS77_9BACL|nr:HAMP domain-containing sensor histidine kinase [Paenibacillus radicis (ex Gao et al. 2016)]GGG88496.1 two-component sensor histidine kinase [Paenibacillus radicis (ex Gao et al. 2016)]
MDGAVRILRRFVGSTILISIFLLVLNLITLGAWVFNGMNESPSPKSVTQSMMKHLHLNNGSITLDPEAEELLQQNKVWTMLLNEDGKVMWSYALPDELPRSYSLTDVAKFSRHYLMDYPVYVWEHEGGLAVIGYPKDSYVKYQFNYSVSWIQDIPFRSFILLVGNIALALLLSLFIGSRLIRSIAPLIRGIHALADKQSAHVEPKGVLSSLAASINHTSELLQQQNVALKARDEARSNWIAGISHDIRTPLSMVLGYASELEESDSLPSEQQQKAGIIRQQGEKLRSLIHDLNLVSMLEYEMQPLHIKPIRLSALARQAAADFMNNGLDERFSLELEFADEQLKVNGDEKLLLRAITNLVQNSVAHNAEGCRIKLQTQASSDREVCRLIVTDNGKGVSASVLPDLLELPYSSRRKHPVHNGHGLGLPMVARIAKAHQGQLILRSKIGQGLEVIIELPAADACT